jgi:hypothetical protein
MDCPAGMIANLTAGQQVTVWPAAESSLRLAPPQGPAGLQLGTAAARD